MKTIIKKNVVKVRKTTSKSWVKELLKENGKTEQWLIDEFKNKRKINKSTTEEFIKKCTGFSLANSMTILLYLSLKIPLTNFIRK